jgi:hypothetical protein
MFGDAEGVELGALEDEEEESTETQSTQPIVPSAAKPISIEQLEQQTFSRLEQDKPREHGFGQPPQTHHPSPFDQNQPNFMQSNPNTFSQFPGHQQPPMQQHQFPGFENPMGFPGFGSDPFSGFGQPLDNPMGMQSAFGDSMGFGGSMFGAPYGRDEEFEKIFGHTGPPGGMGGFFSQGDPTRTKQEQDFGGMFNFGMSDNQFMAQNDDEDEEEDDWLMDDQFQDKHLGFIDQHGETPNKAKRELDDDQETLKHIKTEEVIERAYKYVKTEKKRVPKPRRVHTFEPKLREKKRFEKLFDKEDQEEAQNRKPSHQDLSMYLVKKYWDLRDDPTSLEVLSLIQNPFAHHVVSKRNSPPQFYINKDGPIHISELFMWFNQGLIPKTFLIGYDENCFKYNSRPSFLFEKFFNEHANNTFSPSQAPEDLIKQSLHNTVEEHKFEEEQISQAPPAEENKQQTTPFFNPHIPHILQDEGVRLIDASQLESNLIAASRAQNQMNSFPQVMGGRPAQQPFDPAIVSFQAARPPHQK